MSKRNKYIYFINAFSGGLIVPVLSLVYLAHGASIGNVSMFVSIAAVTIMIVELPSGMIADFIGRKKIFVISHVLTMLSYFLLLFCQSPVILGFSLILKGIGMAFSSGSFEALIVEEHIEKYGEDSMAQVNGRLFLVDCVGYGLGAMCGGVLGTIGSRYTMLLIVIVCIEGIVVLLSGVFIKEEWKRVRGKSHFEDLKYQITVVGNALKKSQTLKVLMFMSSLMGNLVVVIEVYWQQTFLVHLPENRKWILGFVSCIAYGSAIFGSKIGERCISKGKKGSLIIYWIFRMLLPMSLMALGASVNGYQFIACYAAAYVIIGSGDLVERTFLHQNTENEYRASMLSLYSLFIRGGGVISSVIASTIVTYKGLGYVWFIIPILALTAMIGMKIHSKNLQP